MTKQFSLGFILRCEECGSYVSTREAQAQVECPECRHDMYVDELVQLDVAAAVIVSFANAMSEVKPILEQLRS